ncbi:NAD-dependent epimerase/dehydratase family protein [Ancylomarina euxinus]|uniref:GDP-L-fucose synthase n=1 Tax=Ancylomarina euxinus TaxID=2283627 RepID=A0A425XWP4_9BACT|nr:NAD-dependent epimerase/dehydratase family protein [Ancylomarina euxinus]MCZ4696350.1 NAD-dependent epimerase/dehydratase family protein [Ancylomarina euxinus]MUP16749.1 NAD-dependent epimerase/dehydratase family protein [Ancylomarina euxinus]RRG19069.1 NAD-dependent epimerase/dehydratase family protein [Ancylomarina euxinus]
MILVTGATGFLGKRVCRKLDEKGIPHIKTSLSLGVDLREKEQVFQFFKSHQIDYVLNCAAYVGGIQFGYKHFGELFTNNLLMTTNLLEATKEFNVKRLVNPISNCAYPGEATLFKESEFWDGPLHESVMVYGFVRKAFWVGSWAYNYQYGLDIVNIILSNMYGPEDHFEEERSHALGALIMKFVDAKENNSPCVDVWGSGKPVREWLHVDDGAEAMVRSLEVDSHREPINIGVAQGISIIEMAEIIKNIVGYTGEIKLDPSKPDGAPYKTVDGSKGEKLFGWKPETDFIEGVKSTVNWYLKNR